MTSRSKEWLDLYYPVKASDVPKTDVVAGVRHSLLKWRGLMQCADYGLKIDDRAYAVYDETGAKVLDLSAASCALCLQNWVSCGTCPIFRAVGYACGDRKKHLYSVSLIDPSIMVDALERTLKYVEYKPTKAVESEPTDD